MNPGAISQAESVYRMAGRRIVLERVGPAHLDFIAASLKNAEFWGQYRSNQPRNPDRERLAAALEKESLSKPEKLRKLEWIVSRNSTAGPVYIGLGCLADFVPALGRAELLVGIVDPADRVGGAALEATLLVMDYAFNRAQLHKLVSYVYARNRRAQANTKSLGFVQEGLLREHFHDRLQGRYLDVCQNGMLIGEFRSNKRLARLSIRLLGRDITQQNTSAAMAPGEDSDWQINVRLDY